MTPKFGIFSQLLRLVVTELPKFFLLFGELCRTLLQILPPNLMRGPSPPPPDMAVPPSPRNCINSNALLINVPVVQIHWIAQTVMTVKNEFNLQIQISAEDEENDSDIE